MLLGEAKPFENFPLGGIAPLAKSLSTSSSISSSPFALNVANLLKDSLMHIKLILLIAGHEEEEDFTKAHA